MKRSLPFIALGVLLLASRAAAQPPVQIDCKAQHLPPLPEFSRATGLANSTQAYDARHRFMVDVDRLCQRGYSAVLWDHEVAAVRPLEPAPRLAVADTR